jgi:hypothetical protein
MKTKLLIPASRRSYFIILFTVLTVILWIFRFDLARPISHKLTGTFFEDGLVWGLFMGTAQWLVLREYISSRYWILATTIGWGICMGFYGTFNPAATFLIAPLFLGFTQWFFLRRYVQYSWAWVIVPVLFHAPVGIFDNLKVNSFDHKIVTGIIVGLVPAISFCLLHKKDQTESEIQ